MTSSALVPAVLTGEVGFLVTGDWCARCGDTNFDDARVCLTCTYPDHPCSRAYLEACRGTVEGSVVPHG